MPNFTQIWWNIKDIYGQNLIMPLQKNMPYNASIIKRVIYEQQHYVEIICTDWMQNVQNAGKI